MLPCSTFVELKMLFAATKQYKHDKHKYNKQYACQNGGKYRSKFQDAFWISDSFRKIALESPNAP